MKVVVIGGSGPIGSKLVETLTEHGREAVAASLDAGGSTRSPGRGWPRRWKVRRRSSTLRTRRRSRTPPFKLTCPGRSDPVGVPVGVIGRRGRC